MPTPIAILAVASVVAPVRGLMTSPSQKTVVFVRHGVSEMNVALSRQPWGSRNFRDPNILDAPLTSRGRAQAAALRDRVAKLVDPRQPGGGLRLVASSPLTRALASRPESSSSSSSSCGGTLETTELAFGEHLAGGSRAVALPLAAERVYLSSDVGTPRPALEARFSRLCDFSALPRDDDPPAWWWTPPSSSCAEAEEEWRPAGSYPYAGEPKAAFLERMRRLRAWIVERPEPTVAVICHWGVIHALTGHSFANCELREVPVEDLRIVEPPY